MRILFVDQAADGHHIAYAKAVIDSFPDAEKYCLAPFAMEIQTAKPIIFPEKYHIRSFFGFVNWMRFVRKTIKQLRPDAVHFLFADSFYRFAGMMLPKKTRVTIMGAFHGVYLEKRLKRYLSIKTFRRFSACVVHTSYNRELLGQIPGVTVFQNEYPHIHDFGELSAPQAKKKVGFRSSAPIVGFFGATASYKGLDLFLSALPKITRPFSIMIAGSPTDITEEQIRSALASFQGETKLVLRRVTDEELATFICACDIVMTPYRNWFNGASGPMTEAVWSKKCIVSTDSKSLGRTVRENHLGFTFRGEDVASLASVFDEALERPFVCDETYLRYRQSISLESFRDRMKRIFEGFPGYPDADDLDHGAHE